MSEAGGRSRRREEERLRDVYAGYGAQGASRRWSLENPGYRLLVEERRRALEGALARGGLLPLAGAEVLDVGCGNGAELAALTALGAEPARLHGVDLLADRIDQARRDHPHLDLRTGNAERLDFGAETFDLLLSYTVFSSILDEAMAAAVAAEMARVLKPGGAILWYDLRYSNPANRAVRGVSRRRLARWFGGFDITVTQVGLLPPVARRLGSTARYSYPVLSRVAPLRSHLVGLLRRPR